MDNTVSQYDCSDMQTSTDSINHMNRYFQLHNLPELEFKHEQLGQAHEPLFQATVNFEGCEFVSRGRTKKDSEKKIKAYIWKMISEEILIIESKVKKKVKNDEVKTPRFTPFINFKEFLSREFPHNDRPILIIDLENLGEKALNNPQFKSVCTSENIGVICVSSRFVPENDGEIKFIRRDDFHRDSADEGIRRVIYYMMDHLHFKKIGLITMDHFGQNLKDVFIETNEKFLLFRDIEEFNVKYFRLTQDCKDHFSHFPKNHNHHHPMPIAAVIEKEKSITKEEIPEAIIETQQIPVQTTEAVIEKFEANIDQGEVYKTEQTGAEKSDEVQKSEIQEDLQKTNGEGQV